MENTKKSDGGSDPGTESTMENTKKSDGNFGPGTIESDDEIENFSDSDSEGEAEASYI